MALIDSSRKSIQGVSERLADALIAECVSPRSTQRHGERRVCAGLGSYPLSDLPLRTMARLAARKPTVASRSHGVAW